MSEDPPPAPGLRGPSPSPGPSAPSAIGPPATGASAEAHAPTKAKPVRYAEPPLPTADKPKASSLAKAVQPSKPGSSIRPLAIGAFVVGALGGLATWIFVPDARMGGAAALVGVGLGVCALVFAAGALVVRRKSPRKLGLPAIAAILGALACASSGGAAWLARTPASQPDEAAEPAMRAWRLGEAEARARAGALFGMVGVPGVLLGALGIWLGIRARAKARAAAPPLNVGVESVPRAWAAFAGVGTLSIAGIGLDAVAAAAPVTRVEHPHLAQARAASASLQRGDVEGGCNALETALDPEVLPAALLEQELPNYRELADRCVTFRLQGLPTGIPCVTAAGKVLASRAAHAAGAEDRIKHACTVF